MTLAVIVLIAALTLIVWGCIGLYFGYCFEDGDIKPITKTSGRLLSIGGQVLVISIIIIIHSIS